ncbi:hypothetical protein ST47_g6020 [Ascochyta rabiei]|uniref:Hydrolase n=1 Tax=Didymella rabiei TaxID=5454 RepID=A0A163D187_DIDRA|nr:hypothetical protein ST47_g6020 [Ascochyta rabiei]
MHLLAVYTLLLSILAITAVRALPLNASAAGVGNYIVQTAGEYNPSNLASDAIWDKYRKKGDHYQCLFEANDENAGRLVEDSRTPPSAQSVWKGTRAADRHIWNWHELHFDEDDCNFEYLNLKDAFDALNLDAYCEEEGGHNMGWGLGHYDEEQVDKITDPNTDFFPMIPVIEQTYTVGDKIYKSTGGYYIFVINQIDGAIVALNIFSPHNAVKTHWRSIGGTAKDEDLPKLRYMSDLVWGKWVENNDNVKNLRVYVVHNVLNTETTTIVSRAMRNKLVPKLDVWPGTAFDKEKDPVEFQAIIGSPIGGTMSILLAQHKEELGNKEIYQINVISDSKSIKPFQVPELHLFFQIRDVPPPKKAQEERSVIDKRTGYDSGTTDAVRRSHRIVSSPADNTILSITRDVFSVRYLPDHTEITKNDDYEGQHKGDVEADYDCDIERLYLKEAFDGLRLDTSLDEENKLAPGHNTGFKLQHFDKTLKDPSGGEIDVLEQPYVIDSIARTTSLA